MGDKSSVKVTFLGDAAALAAAAAKARASLNSVGKSAEKSGGAVEKSLGRIGSAAKGAIVGVMGGSLVAGGKALFDMSAKMELMDAKAKTVFGDQISSVQKWGRAHGAAMGLTSKEVVGLSANFADLLIPMGFTRKAAADMSTSVVGLSGALSQWSGGTRSAAQVSEILAKAMLGERDGLKELGISISDADVKARLLKNGWSDLTGQALAQATAMSTQQLIMEKSTDAQAAFAKGAGTLAAKKAVLIAKVKELRDRAIGALIPKLHELSAWVTSTGVPMLQRFAQGFKNGEGAGGQLASALRMVASTARAAAAIVLPFAQWLVAHPVLFKTVAQGALALAVALKLQATWGRIVAVLMPRIAAGTAAQGTAAAGAAVANTANARAMMAARTAALGFGFAAVWAANKWAQAMNASVEAQSRNEDRAVADSNMADVIKLAAGMGGKKGWDKKAFEAAIATGNVAEVARFISDFKHGRKRGSGSSSPSSGGGAPSMPSFEGLGGGGGGGAKTKMVSKFKGTFEGVRVYLRTAGKVTVDAARDMAERAASVAAKALAPLDRAIEASKARLATLRQQSADLRELASTNAKSFASVLGFKAEEGKQTTSGDVLASMRARLAKVREFAANMKKLAAAGLNKDTFAEILGAGVEGGGATAAALAGNTNTVTELNDLQGQVNSASSGLGSMGSAFVYGDAIRGEAARLAAMQATRRELGTVKLDLRINGRTLQTELLKLKRDIGGNLGLA